MRGRQVERGLAERAAGVPRVPVDLVLGQQPPEGLVRRGWVEDEALEEAVFLHHMCMRVCMVCM